MAIAFTVVPDRVWGKDAPSKNLNAKPPGDWNQVRILLEPAGDDKERLRFWFNGRKRVDLIVDHAPDSDWSKRLHNARDPEHFAQAFFKAESGHILLQDHGRTVALRTIRIRELDGAGGAGGI